MPAPSGGQVVVLRLLPALVCWAMCRCARSKVDLGITGKVYKFNEENRLAHQNDSDRLWGYGWEEPDRSDAIGTARQGES